MRYDTYVKFEYAIELVREALACLNSDGFEGLTDELYPCLEDLKRGLDGIKALGRTTTTAFLEDVVRKEIYRILFRYKMGVDPEDKTKRKLEKLRIFVTHELERSLDMLARARKVLGLSGEVPLSATIRRLQTLIPEDLPPYPGRRARKGFGVLDLIGGKGEIEEFVSSHKEGCIILREKDIDEVWKDLKIIREACPELVAHEVFEEGGRVGMIWFKWVGPK